MESGGPVVRDAFARGREILVTPFSNFRPNAPALVDRIANYSKLSLPPSHCFRPQQTRVARKKDTVVRESAFDLAVLEMAFWACENGQVGGRICHVRAHRADELMACAKLVSLRISAPRILCLFGLPRLSVSGSLQTPPEADQRQPVLSSRDHSRSGHSGDHRSVPLPLP